MKTILIAIAVAFAINSFGQDSITHTRQFYFNKSKNQKTTAIVLLAGGATLMVSGLILMVNTPDFMNDETGQAATGTLMFLTGPVAMLVSIPFFISSGKNARRAALVFGTQTLPQHIPNSIALRRQVSVGMQIRF